MATNPENGRTILGIIIEEGNVIHLKNAKPIHIHCEEMSLPEIRCSEIMIAYYPTFEHASKNLKEKGYIDKNTPTHIEKKRAN